MRARTLARLSSLVVVLALPAAAAAQTRFDAGVHVSFVSSGEFDTTTTGVGGRVAWYPSSWIGAEAELTFYPQDFPDGRAFTSSQREGLFGVTVGSTPGMGAAVRAPAAGVRHLRRGAVPRSPAS